MRLGNRTNEPSGKEIARGTSRIGVGFVLTMTALLLAPRAGFFPSRASAQTEQAGGETESEHALDPDRPWVEAVKVDEPIVIDGRLDEPAWQKVGVATDFIQTTPDEGEPATVRTIVRVLYDETTLFFGFECCGEEIVARLRPRDSEVGQEDFIWIALDTFHDHQNCHWFDINPYGVQADGYSQADGAAWPDKSWDGVWEVKTAIEEGVWFAEIAIPFKTLRFPRTEEQTWGINFERRTLMPNEDSRWASITVAEGTTRKMSRAGHLVGLRDVQPGLHVEFLPYVTTRYERRKGGEIRPATGLDFKYGISSDLTLDLTLNPDYAHIEADEEEINLTRFELHLREKRPFFLEGRELFQTPIQLFYTRRIRDPEGAAKITGKMSRVSFSALVARDKTPGGTSAVYGALRIKRDIMKRSYMGIIAAGRSTSADRRANLSADMNIGFANTGNLSCQVAKSFNPGVTRENTAIHTSLGWGGRRAGFGAGYRGWDQEFDVNSTGFMWRDPHIAHKEWNSYHYLKHWFDKRSVLYVELGQWGERAKDSIDSEWEWTWDKWFSLEFREGSGLWLWETARKIVVHEPDAMSAASTTETSYRGDSGGAGFYLFPRRRISGDIAVGLGDQYDWGEQYFGRTRWIDLYVKLAPLDNFLLTLGSNLVCEYYRDGRFDELKTATNLRATYQVNTELFWRVFVSQGGSQGGVPGVSF